MWVCASKKQQGGPGLFSSSGHAGECGDSLEERVSPCVGVTAQILSGEECWAFLHY